MKFDFSHLVHYSCTLGRKKLFECGLFNYLVATKEGNAPRGGISWLWRKWDNHVLADSDSYNVGFLTEIIQVIVKIGQNFGNVLYIDLHGTLLTQI